MEELVKISKSTGGRKIVDARELHEALESKQKFADWVKSKVVDNPYFIENEDYALLHNITKQISSDGTNRGGHNRVDYALTLTTAKKVSMTENTYKGNEVRDYFISCEKNLQKLTVQHQIPTTFAEALLLAANQAKELELKEKELEEAKPKILFANSVVTSKDSILIGNLSKILKQNGISIGRNRLFIWLRAKHYLTQKNDPSQKSMELGLMELKERSIVDPEGNSIGIKFTTKVTGKGQIYFINKFLNK